MDKAYFNRYNIQESDPRQWSRVYTQGWEDGVWAS